MSLDSTALTRAGAEVTPTSLVIADPSLPYEVLEDLCSFLGVLGRGCEWWTGDLLLQIEMRYGDKVTQAADATGFAPQTIMNRMSICSRIPRQRRREELNFSVHAEVAYREPEEQDQWLERAVLNGWKRGDLRAAMRNGGTPLAEPGALMLPPAVVESVTCPNCGHVIA